MIEVLKQMVEALEWCHGGEPVGTAEAIQAGKKLIAEWESQEPVAINWNAIHEKLELVWYRELSADEGLDEIQDLIDTHPPQRTESEPVAYINVEMRRLEFAHDYVKWDTPTTIKLDKIPLYTHPPQRTWVGLTDEEVRQMCGSVPSMKEAVREAESKLKERNT